MELSEKQVGAIRASIMSLVELSPDISELSERQAFILRRSVSNISIVLMISSLSREIDEKSLDYISVEGKKLRSIINHLDKLSMYASLVFEQYSKSVDLYDIKNIDNYLDELKNLVYKSFEVGSLSRNNIYTCWKSRISNHAGSFLGPIFNSGREYERKSLDYMKYLNQEYFGEKFYLIASIFELYFSSSFGREYKFTIAMKGLSIGEGSDFPEFIVRGANKIFDRFDADGEIISFARSIEREFVFESPISDDGFCREDMLERRPLAQILARRIKDFHETSRKSVGAVLKNGLKTSAGLAINLTAPWGEGKTSLLHMLENALKDPTVGDEKNSSSTWIVIHFNAWDHEHRRPPWWPMIEALRAQAAQQLAGIGRCKAQVDLDLYWYWRTILSDRMHWLVGLGVVGFILGGVVMLAGQPAMGQSLTMLSGGLALATAIAMQVRGLVLGNAQAANFHFNLKNDPLNRARGLFQELVERTECPVCICIDDLDRCDADFVVDLLEGIQTAFRHPDVVYVVAADRKWIKAAFEHRYTKAFGQVPTLGNPLGYLFVDKIFQDSITLQPPPEAVRVAYWHKVIGQHELDQRTSSEAPMEEMRAMEAAKETAEEAFKAAKGLDDIQALARQASEDDNRTETEKRAFRNKAFEAIAQSADARRAAEHAFKDLHAIIPFNPRALKRLSNTLTLRMAEEARSGQRVAATTLARWVVLEFSYPELADLLYENPGWASYLIDPEQFAKSEEDKREALRPYVGVEAIQNIFEKQSAGLEHKLSVDDVFIITQGRPREREASL